jgi:hypothetical protein
MDVVFPLGRATAGQHIIHSPSTEGLIGIKGGRTPSPSKGDSEPTNRICGPELREKQIGRWSAPAEGSDGKSGTLSASG